MIDAPELVFRRNMVHTTGASETVKAGVRSLIELNDLSRSGYLQNNFMKVCLFALGIITRIRKKMRNGRRKEARVWKL